MTRSVAARDQLCADSARLVRLPDEWRAARFPTRIATLDNGLTTIAHRDRKAPIVAVYVAYHAGSRDERPGKSGLAHLFEHLMYSGTRQFPGNTFRHLEGIGATSINAISREDYTAYFATVPKNMLNHALAIEAARISTDAFDGAEVERQREVVRNELLQRESEPYGSVNRIIAQQTYPRDHPYSHPVDGLLEELDQLALADAIAWRRTHYHPANAVVVIAGDIEPAEAIAQVRRHFGKIACAQERAVRMMPTIANLAQTRRVVVSNRAASRIYMVWNVPQYRASEHPGLELLTEVLAGAIDSRLWRTLVEERRLASAIGGELRTREFGSQAVLWATAREPNSLSKLEEVMRAEIRQFAQSPPAGAELDRARFRRFAQLLRDTERLCGPRSKTELLGTAWIMTGDANVHEKRFARIASIRPREVCNLARTWLREDALVIEVRTTAVKSARRGASEIPPASSTIRLGGARVAKQLARHSRTTAIRLAGSPLCEVRLVLDSGAAQDPPGRSGLAGVAIAALTDTAARHGALTAAARLNRLGAQLEGVARLDASIVRLSALGSMLASVLPLFLDLISRRLIDDAAVERAKSARLAFIQSEKSRPLDLALRTLPRLVYGLEHRYAQPPSGSAAEVVKINGEEVRALVARWRARDTASVIVVGPHREQALRAADRVRAGLCGSESKVAGRSATRAVPVAHPRVLLVDQPGRSQSAIFAARAIGPRSSSDFTALAAADNILGGRFTSRLNLNLREAKGWCYGARTIITSAREASVWIAHAFVAPERTVAAMREIDREWRAIATVSLSELKSATDYLVLRAAAESETAVQLAAAAEDLAVFRLPRSWGRDFHAGLRALRPDDIAAACAELVRQQLTWMVIGDASLITTMIEAAGLGTVEVVADSASIP